MTGRTSSHTIAARVHGRYLVDVPAGEPPLSMLVGFHGYGEGADHMMAALQRVRGTRAWLLVSVQALNRFYAKSQETVASWMTRQDRDLAIDDNITYVASVVDTVQREHKVRGGIVYAGFSQGVAMAYRAAAFAAGRGGHLPPPMGGIMLAGDVPPDVAPHAASLPPILIGRGTDDTWYTEAKAAADLEHFRMASRPPQVHVFNGGHAWHDSFVAAAGEFLDQTSSTWKARL